MLARYEVGSLGWAQFERAIDELLALEGLTPPWEGRADVGRVALLEDRTAVAVVWVRASMQARLDRPVVLGRLAQTLRKMVGHARVRLFTNLALEPDEAHELVIDGTYVGPAELTQFPEYGARAPTPVQAR